MSNSEEHKDILDKINKVVGDWIGYGEDVKIAAIKEKGNMYDSYCKSLIADEDLIKMQERITWLEYKVK